MPDLVHYGCHVQQRLRRDAADVQADPAQRCITLDEDHLQTQIGATERGRIAAWAGAEHEQVAVLIDLAAIVCGGRRRRCSDGRRCGRLRFASGRRGIVGSAGGRGLLDGSSRVRSAAPPSASIVQTKVPCFTLSPSLTLSFLQHTARAGRNLHRRLVRFDRDQALLRCDGVAGLTSNSITVTSSKSPMSGTFSSIVASRCRLRLRLITRHSNTRRKSLSSCAK